MKIVIGHLYYDLMNLYGENGNIKVLEYQLKHQKVDVDIKKLSIDDEINFDELDLIYIGSGTENNKNIVLKDLLKYKEQIKEYYKKNKFLFITGNAIELFGQYIIDKDKNVCEGLNLFSYYAKENEKRNVKEVVAKACFLTDKVIGFINNQSDIYDKKNNKLDGYGIYKKHFYGTYILGPILARNPEFLEYILRRIIKNKKPKFKFKPINTLLDEEAYLDYIAFKNNI